jgi:microcystin-dependent protein
MKICIGFRPLASVLAASLFLLALPSRADQEYLGEMRWVSFNFAPKGWAMCNGQLLPINQNQALFALLGTAYGGNGTTNFALPDFRGRIMEHWGQGPGLSNYDMGQRGGSETVTLTENELPVHTHQAYGSNAKANKQAPENAYPAYLTTQNGASYDTTNVRGYRPTAGTSAMASGVLGQAGGSQPAANVPPFITLNCIISLQGAFPSRN